MLMAQVDITGVVQVDDVAGLLGLAFHVGPRRRHHWVQNAAEGKRLSFVEYACVG